MRVASDLLVDWEEAYHRWQAAFLERSLWGFHGDLPIAGGYISGKIPILFIDDNKMGSPICGNPKKYPATHGCFERIVYSMFKAHGGTIL